MQWKPNPEDTIFFFPESNILCRIAMGTLSTIMDPNANPSSPRVLYKRPEQQQHRVRLSLLEYSESSFTDPHSVVLFDEPTFDANEYSHIGKTYEGVEPHRMGGHSVVQNEENPKDCVHHFDPNYRDYFTVRLEKRTVLTALCISTRFFAGNPASALTITIFDDVQKEETTIPISVLKPDSEHWIDNMHFTATRIKCSFKAGGITRIWAYGSPAEQQQKILSWLSKDSKVLFKEDDFFGGPNFALSQKANRSNRHMLGWETSRSAMGLRAVFPITPGMVNEIQIDTYRHVNNYLRSAWVFSACLPPGQTPQQEESPLWLVTSSEGETTSTHNLKSFFTQQHQGKTKLPTYTIEPKAQAYWTLETTFNLRQDAMHIQSNVHFPATHICIMLLPHGGLHAIKIMGTPQ
ncbi:MAG: hypothetical protein VX278_17210 [Myxococcota bacterium]|nr:hypothetical protein [Myxococcota bacterium]